MIVFVASVPTSHEKLSWYSSTEMLGISSTVAGRELLPARTWCLFGLSALLLQFVLQHPRDALDALPTFWPAVTQDRGVLCHR